MKRVSAVDVVNAYKATNLIPIRRAWQTKDQRGGCAIDALAWHFFNTAGHVWAKDNLHEDYTRGFTDAWDAEDPIGVRDHVDSDKNYQAGYWDAILCREAVEMEFSSITEVETA